MDQRTNDSESTLVESFGRASRTSSSLRRRSLNIIGSSSQIDDYIESENVSEAGDIGDRALFHSNRLSDAESLSLSVDHAMENGAVVPIPEDKLLQSYGFWSNDPTAVNMISPVSPLAEEITSSLSTNLTKFPDDKMQAMQADKNLPKLLDYITCLIHLAVFGILGVLTRYLLQKLFGPGVAGVTSNQSILYLDLPSNMVGSFFMGWFGVVFKGDISSISDYLAIGLSTGYLGSLTTFSGWNQKMLDLSVDGHWLFAVLGFVLGLFLAEYSIILGIETAKGFRWLLNRNSSVTVRSNWRVDGWKRQLAVVVILVLMWGLLWSVSGVMVKKEFKSGSSEAQLWLACMVGPPGVWLRWFLARLNGQGLGKAGLLRWVPFGTLIANVSAACIMAALATIKEVVKTKTCETVATGIQFGLLGCLSTVSTFIAEFNAMRESKHPWRAYAYAAATMGVSFGFGTLIYSVPVWTKGYK